MDLKFTGIHSTLIRNKVYSYYKVWCRLHLPLRKREGVWAELTFPKTSGTVTKDRDKISQQLTSASPVTIPGTIAAHISAPVPFSFVIRRMDDE